MSAPPAWRDETDLAMALPILRGPEHLWFPEHSACPDVEHILQFRNMMESLSLLTTGLAPLCRADAVLRARVSSVLSVRMRKLLAARLLKVVCRAGPPGVPMGTVRREPTASTGLCPWRPGIGAASARRATGPHRHRQSPWETAPCKCADASILQSISGCTSLWDVDRGDRP